MGVEDVIFEQLPNWDFQGRSQVAYAVHRGRVHGVLKLDIEGAVHPRQVGESFLRESCLETGRTQRRTERSAASPAQLVQFIRHTLNVGTLLR